MKRKLTALALGAVLLTSSAQAATLTLNGEALHIGECPIYAGSTFVPLRSVVQALRPTALVQWEDGQATALDTGFSLTARPGDSALVYNGETVSLSLPVRLENGCTLVPIRPLAALLGAEVSWNGQTGVVSLTTSGSELPEQDVYWLSRIISAESRGESWEGKIAVGNVVLNRVQSPEFPDTIYDVIFDERWGGQFEPVRNGTIYQSPTEESVQAAIACLNGANTAGDSLYFLAPDLTGNHWTMENRTYVTTIGVHWFYE